MDDYSEIVDRMVIEDNRLLMEMCLRRLNEMYMCEEINTKWHRRFLAIAKEVASWSKDPSTQVGAVLVRSRRILSTGYNGMPRGMDDDNPHYYERPQKYMYFEHAERNAIYNCASNGIATAGASLYIWELSPCADCARGIVQAGIEHVILPSSSIPDRWVESTDTALEILKAGGVAVEVL